jgi:hypothetical protein
MGLSLHGLGSGIAGCTAADGYGLCHGHGPWLCWPWDQWPIRARRGNLVSDRTVFCEREGGSWRRAMRHASRTPLLRRRVFSPSVSREWKLLLPACSACQLATEALPDGNPIGRWSSPGGANTTGTHVMTAIR